MKPRPPVKTSASPMEGREAGLTLIEMIVALAIGALVVAFLAEGTGLLRQFTRIGTAVSAQDETMAIRDHLRRTIGSTMGSAGSSQKTGFAGVGDTVVFTAPGDRLLEAGGPVRVTLAVIAENGGMSLVETRAAPGGGDSKGRTRRLLAGTDRVAFNYYGSLSGSTAATWTTEWTDPEASPSLMRIDVAFKAGDRRRWPPFVVLMPSGGSPPPQGSSPGTDTASTGKVSSTAP
ncbi:prepilin-type N-terminal cleavage/methylation domain-containing protein [Lichenifustis flavocetrariae]|uniref:Prepilin-type N-terminal cleavage/methylation domain-containing protein n=1 Tax=Lichenifustis flavocetrariae TaxID=2949735 RepID=A0AA41YUB9_9HYPH|nr:prepilin-type N-terminal cleavage/methylation domain-containing protein [Lichenifustis flavocetrariae]MCW6508721.1 prepilin-type N-terminal cleavage/methylation domain-containing protein [Lichenifustis flavocetrariae]